MSARILLPVRPHIKKYITVQYGKELAVIQRGTVPLLLYNMLELHKKEDPGVVKPSQRLIDNLHYLPYPIFIGDACERDRGLYLSQEKIIAFNDSIDQMIREELYRWCNHPGSIDGKVDFDIVRFRDMYGITEDEMPFDNLKRWYYRNRLRLDDRAKVVVNRNPQLELVY